MTVGVSRDIIWVASSLEDLRRFPEPIRKVMGFALFQAQCGGKHLQAKPLMGFGGAGVLEVVEEGHRGPETRDGSRAIPAAAGARRGSVESEPKGR